MTDPLGERMKSQYENRTRYYLPRRTYTIIRLDGKSFHTWTKGLHKPYDKDLVDIMSNTASLVTQDIEGAICAYTQSDEISILLTDFRNVHTQAWFDGNLQKIVSISAGICTAWFNHLSAKLWPHKPLAFFDSRAFTIPDPVEVYNYFLWRQRDCIKNSIHLTARNYFSHKQLYGLNGKQMREKMAKDAGVNWDDYPDEFKYGSFIYKKPSPYNENYTAWSREAAPIFNQTDLMKEYIPRIEP